MRSNATYWVGMVAFVLVALAGQSDHIPDGFWRHAVAIGGIVGTAVSGYLIQHRGDV
jgi:hypothetical protein